MKSEDRFKVVSFYSFMEMGDLESIKARLMLSMREFNVMGTIIIAAEGFNGTVAALVPDLDAFIPKMNGVLNAEPELKVSFSDNQVFARRKVKIKKEIVTLKRKVDIGLGCGTHVAPDEWNDLLQDPETLVIDARNDYEYRVGTFEGAVNPGVESFSELPAFFEQTYDPNSNPKIAMFCTGGIRCEKLAPYLIEKGFANIFQLEGGILRYLEEVDAEKSRWRGECFVFDERITVATGLEPGSAPDHSAEKKSSKKPSPKAGNTPRPPK